MKIMYIGGAADGDEIESHENVKTAQVTFRLAKDFPNDKSRVHTYVKKTYRMRSSDGQESDIEFMIHEELPDDAVEATIQSRLPFDVIDVIE